LESATHDGWNIKVTNDTHSTHTGVNSNAKPEHIEDCYARISRSALERECASNWHALMEIADLFNDLEDGSLNADGFVTKVHEIVCDGMGMSVRRNEAWRERIRSTFSIVDKGDVA